MPHALIQRGRWLSTPMSMTGQHPGSTLPATGEAPPLVVVVVGDSRARTRALRNFLSAPGFVVAAEVCTAREAEAAVVEHRPGAVLLDLDPASGGIEAIERIMGTRPTPIVVCGAMAAHSQAVLAAGAVDVVGALDAFVDGGERRVDLAEVNGRTFVNNVSLGVYAEAVSQDRYRESKLRTLFETLSETLGPEGEAKELRWVDSDGVDQSSTALVLVSNNAYLLGPTLGSGTRPRLDAGVLGVIDFHPPVGGKRSKAPRWRELTTPRLEVESDAPVPVGVDGEALVLEPPIRFRIRPKALRVRIARNHPGASPSADIPRGPLSGFKQLIWLATTGEGGR